MVQALVGNRTITVEDNERRECEVWTRVMGYYRPVSEFNIGKKSEHAERIFFREDTTMNSLN
jgi:anaerobic ribonucleoside-triphosphate reductase